MKTNTAIRWTPAEIEKLRAIYSVTPSAELVTIFGRSAPAIDLRARSMGLYRQAADGSRRKRGGQHVPLGTERIRDGNLMRKIAMTGRLEDDWRRVDVLEWEAANGPVPNGMTLTRPAIRRLGRELMLVKKDDIPMHVANRLMSPEMKRLAYIKGQIKLELNRLEKENPEQKAENPLKKLWNFGNDDCLRETYLTSTNTELARHFNVSEKTIRKRLATLNLRRPRWNAWTEEEKNLLAKVYYKLKTSQELEKMFDRKATTVRAAAKRFGLTRAAR